MMSKERGERPFASLCDAYWANPAALDKVEESVNAILTRHAQPAEYLVQLATESAAQRSGLPPPVRGAAGASAGGSVDSAALEGVAQRSMRGAKGLSAQRRAASVASAAAASAESAMAAVVNELPAVEHVAPAPYAQCGPALGELMAVAQTSARAALPWQAQMSAAASEELEIARLRAGAARVAKRVDLYRREEWLQHRVGPPMTDCKSAYDNLMNRGCLSGVADKAAALDLGLKINFKSSTKAKPS